MHTYLLGFLKDRLTLFCLLGEKSMVVNILTGSSSDECICNFDYIFFRNVFVLKRQLHFEKNIYCFAKVLLLVDI
jgi:hypothetical protein